MVKLLYLSMIAACTSMQAATPDRIVSLNPCTDAILVHLAKPEQIAALSAYSHDPAATSIPVSIAQKFRVTNGTAESIIQLKPDLVIGSSFTPPQTVTALKHFGIAFRGFNAPSTIAASKVQVTEIAGLIGQSRAGIALNQQIDAATWQSTAVPIESLVYRDEGLVLGAGSLTADIMSRTGFRNISAMYGIPDWGILPLEKLVRHPPPVILHAEIESGARARGERLLTHPVFNHLSGQTALRTLPSNLVNCGGPSIIAAAQKLREIRISLKPQ
jgi:iron complex transport system substrate-binding protein